MKQLIALSTLLFTFACGDNTKGNPLSPDASSVDGQVDPDAPEPDAPPDAPPSFTPPEAKATILSAAGPDQLLGASAGPAGSFYVAGWSAADTTAGTARNIVVGKLAADGTPDAGFGTEGFLNTGVAYRGSVSEIDLVTLADGKLLISATVAATTPNALDAADTDIALIKVTAAGALDTTWGGGDGIVTHSFNTSILNTAMPPAPVGRDGVRALAVHSSGAIFVGGLQRGEGLQMNSASPRVDTDFVIAKLTADGALDTTWGEGDGKFVRDIYLNDAHSGATPHAIIVNADGTAILGGYANAGLSTGPQPVLFKVTATGTADTSFAGGIFHDVVLATQTEVYGMAVHGDKLVTGGYGRQTGSINDYISLRFDLATGARDTTVWGDSGLAFFDPTPADNMAGSNCRNAFALPGGKTLLIGSSSRTANTDMMTPQVQDAVFAVLDDDGDLDTAYGTGIVTYQLGNDGLDQFWGGTVSGTNALVVGWRGSRTPMAQTAADNDDSYIVILPLQ